MRSLPMTRTTPRTTTRRREGGSMILPQRVRLTKRERAILAEMEAQFATEHAATGRAPGLSAVAFINPLRDANATPGHSADSPAGLPPDMPDLDA